MNRLTRLAALLFLSLAAPTVEAAPTQAATDEASNRELYGLAEEQAMLARQIQRLRQTMDVLVQRLEAEGRTRAVELLREGLQVLDKRGEGSAAMTLDERMNAARDELSAGKWMQSLERQQEIINDLESLLEVLLDRQDLDKLEQRIEELAATKADLENLRGRQGQLQLDTKNAQQEAVEKQFGDLVDAIESLATDQAKALTQTETAARESGALERERIQAGIAELAAREQQLASLLAEWSELELARAEAALDQLKDASQKAHLAKQSENAAAALKAAAEGLENDLSIEAIAAELENKLDSASASEKALLDQALAALEKASDEGRKGAKAELQAAAKSAAADAKELNAEATDMAGSAQENLNGKGPAKPSDKLQAALDEANLPDSLDQTLTEALRDLSQRVEAARFLPKAAAGAQAENKRTASDLEDALERLTKQKKSSGATKKEIQGLEDALDELATAKEKMEATSSMDPSFAQAAEAALERALDALDRAEQASAGTQAQAQAKTQAGLQAQAAELAGPAPGASAEAMQQAVKAMQKAAEALGQGRLGDAAEAQRESLDALDEAARKARAEAQPEKESSDALAALEQRIEDDLLDLATRLEEEEREKAGGAVQSAASEASKATESLGQGDMQAAEEQQARVQEELDKAMAELEAEQEKYQELRREEILIQLTEELQALLDGHRAQLAEVEAVDAARAGRESPSRAQKLRLRRASREESALAQKAGELTELLRGEGSDVFASAMDEARTDLERAAVQLGSPGAGSLGAGFDSGWRTLSVMRDADRLLTWLLEALNHENQRRREEAPPSGESNDSPDAENRLVPSQAELRLLRSMELDIKHSIEQTIEAWPELANTDPSEIDALILEDLMRLAGRHNRITELFRGIAKKLGIPNIGEEQ